MFELRPTGSTEYENIIEKYIINLKSLKSYVKSVEPVLKNINEDESAKENEFLVKSIMLVIDAKDNPDKYKDDEDLITHIEKLLLEKYNAEFIVDESGVKLRINEPHATKKFDEMYKSYKLNANQINILYRSTMISLVVFFEILVTNLIKKRLYEHPQSASINQRSLTLDDIINLGSLENAMDYLIENEIEGIMRRGYSEWIEYFKKNMKCKFDFLVEYEDQIVEIFQRRNLIVHNDGIVNNTYITKVKKSNKEHLGKKISISKEYMAKSIDLLEKIGLLISYEVWQAMEKRSEARHDSMIDIGFKYMIEERWDLAKEIFTLLINEKYISNINKTIGSINYWLCVKNIDGLDSIIEDLKKQDFSDKSDIIQLCFMALKDEFDDFFELLPKVVPSEMPIDHLKKWPVFATIRREDRYKKFIGNFENEGENGKLTDGNVQVDENVQLEELVESEELEENKAI